MSTIALDGMAVGKGERNVGCRGVSEISILPCVIHSNSWPACMLLIWLTVMRMPLLCSSATTATIRWLLHERMVICVLCETPRRVMQVLDPSLKHPPARNNDVQAVGVSLHITKVRRVEGKGRGALWEHRARKDSSCIVAWRGTETPQAVPGLRSQRSSAINKRGDA